MNYIITDGTNSDFIKLCHGLDEFLNRLVGGEENRAQYIQYNTLDDIHDVIVAYDGDIPVGCASFKHYSGVEFEKKTAEVKRVFVTEAYRGRGISKELMNKLENIALSQGYESFILESGEPLVAAMALYRSIGFKVIPNYGQYTDMSESVCMLKNLQRTRL